MFRANKIQVQLKAEQNLFEAASPFSMLTVLVLRKGRFIYFRGLTSTESLELTDIHLPDVLLLFDFVVITIVRHLQYSFIGDVSAVNPELQEFIRPFIPNILDQFFLQIIYHDSFFLIPFPGKGIPVAYVIHLVTKPTDQSGGLSNKEIKYGRRCFKHKLHLHLYSCHAVC